MLQLVFYEGSQPKTFAERVIATRTRSRFVHAELLFSDGRSFSARAGRTPAVDVIRFPLQTDRCMFVCAPAVAHEDHIRKWCETQIGKRYDYFGLFLGFALPAGLHWNDDQDLWCSEAVTLAMQSDGWMPGDDPYIDPGALFARCMRLGWPVEL
jgi:hypothetical protein